jgi:hypothetical protein
VRARILVLRLQEAEGGNEGRGGADDIKDEDGEAGEGYWDRIALPEEFQPEVRHPATTRRPRDERRHQMQGASSLLSKGLGGSIVRPPGREFRWPQLQPEVHFELPPVKAPMPAYLHAVQCLLFLPDLGCLC